MNTIRFLSYAVPLGFVLGCGPMQTPLPARLTNEEQKEVGDTWDRVLSPVGRCDKQMLLDMLLCTRAYQLGVDKLEFRSESRFSGGSVVMEIRYDRAAPKADRFELKVVDATGKVVRQEQYERAQIERTDKELFVEGDRLKKKKDQGDASPEELKKLEAIEARYTAIEKLSPEYARRQEQNRQNKGKK